MEVVLFNAVVASSSLLVMAMLCYTKFCYLLSVLAPTHIIIIKDNGCMLLITALTIKYRIHLLLNAKEVTWKLRL